MAVLLSLTGRLVKRNDDITEQGRIGAVIAVFFPFG